MGVVYGITLRLAIIAIGNDDTVKYLEMLNYYIELDVKGRGHRLERE